MVFIYGIARYKKRKKYHVLRCRRFSVGCPITTSAWACDDSCDMRCPSRTWSRRCKADPGMISYSPRVTRG